MYPSRDLNFFAGVPAGPIYHQKDALLLSDSHLFGELIVSAIENNSTSTVWAGDQPVDLSALGGCTKA